jgi:hypothetical protein
MLSRIPSVKDTYFQHKVLTKIHGKPIYESLQTVLTELKANASSVPSTLGGGNNGHLGLLLSNARYTALANTIAWVTPNNPGPFVPPLAGTAAQIEAAKDVWKELKQTFELHQATEKALIAQVVESIDPIYLRALLNRATGQYSVNIRALLAHLFTTYGKITPQQVKAKEMELYNMHYDISQPVDTVFNCIDDLSELADHAGSPMSPQQMIDLAYVIFAKQPILQQDLRLWNRRPIAERTWANMMTHLRDAQTDLSSLPSAGDIYHQQQPAHQANVSTMADLVAQRLLDDYHAANPIPEPIPAPPPPLPLDQPTDVANSLQRRETDLQSRETAMMAQMQEMMMNLMRNNGNNGNHNGNNGNNGNNSNGYNGHNTSGYNGNNYRPYNSRGGGYQGRGRGRGRSGGNSRSPQAKQYCWSHGACAHAGRTCNTPAPGHQNDATFDNRLSGSTSGCYWLTA